MEKLFGQNGKDRAVGTLHGRDALPKRWRDSLSGRTGEDDDGRIFALIAQADTQNA